MLKIGTHDSITGEKAKWYSLPLLPFAKTQSKTIKEQYDAGCRLFDIRLKKVFGKWVLAHGGYIVKMKPFELFGFLNQKGDCHVTITYEGGYEHQKEFVAYASLIKEEFKHIKYGGIAIKHSKSRITTQYDYQIPADEGWLDAPSKSYFIKLDGKTWHFLIPIPWLWKKIYYDKVEFNESEYRIVDFL